MSIQMDNTTVRTIAQQCARRFELLVSPPSQYGGGITRTPSAADVSPFAFDDQLARFNIWSSNMSVASSPNY